MAKKPQPEVKKNVSKSILFEPELVDIVSAYQRKKGLKAWTKALFEMVENHPELTKQLEGKIREYNSLHNEWQRLNEGAKSLNHALNSFGIKTGK